MGAVEPPAPTYSPHLPGHVVDEGRLSLAQLEAVVYAGQAHDERLPNGSRKGFFIGDGTGVGKGREISGVILDNLAQGRDKAVWVSFNRGLIEDARRDFAGVGGDPDLLFFQGDTKAGAAITREQRHPLHHLQHAARRREAPGHGPGADGAADRARPGCNSSPTGSARTSTASSPSTRPTAWATPSR